MSEHQGRYHALAHFLAQKGWDVITYDHPGHGTSAPTLGHLPNADWTLVENRLHDAITLAHANAPQQPLWILGHSMGSFTVLDYALRHTVPPNCQGLILVGTDAPLRSASMALHQLSRFMVKRYSEAVVSPLLTQLTLGWFNRRFRPTRTASDWICSNPAVVDAYLADPLCGFELSAGYWQAFSQVLVRLSQPKAVHQLPKALQVMIWAGGQDPVGRFGAGPRQLAERLRDANISASIKLYPTLRHELLNEKDHTLIWRDLELKMRGYSNPIL
jgi:alpha-beta hydrolase superfamily lysophospholipase